MNKDQPRGLYGGSPCGVFFNTIIKLSARNFRKDKTAIKTPSLIRAFDLKSNYQNTKHNYCMKIIVVNSYALWYTIIVLINQQTV